MLDKTLNRDVVLAMRECVMFSGMDDEQFDALLRFSKLVVKPAECMLFQQDLPLTHIYFVYQGAVKLSRSTVKGDEKIIEVILPGRTFAEGVLFKGAPQYPVTATTLKSSTVVAVDGKQLLNLLKSSNELCIKMLAHVSFRLHWMINELDKQTLHNASFRIVDYFLSQIKVTDELSYELKLQVPKRDIASRLSIKPETFSRALKSLEKKGFISVHEKTIVINDIEKIKEKMALEEI